MEKSERINLRVTPEEKTAWAEEAAERHMKLSEFISVVMNERTPKWSDPATPSILFGTPAKCARWMHHRKGTFCGSCNKLI